MKKVLPLLLLICFESFSQDLPVNPAIEHGYWKASWIMHPTARVNDFGVYHFRKKVSFALKPARCIIHVSADNHYRLFVNGTYIGNGPARSDLSNWNFESYDIAPYLHSGNNIIAATVWNFAEYRAYAEISYQTGFIVQADDTAAAMLNTDRSWKVIQDDAYQPFPIPQSEVQTYMVVAHGEKMQAAKYKWGFEQTGYDDTQWPQAIRAGFPAKTKSFGTDGNWMLVKRTIPAMEETEQRFKSIRRISKGAIKDGWLGGKSPVSVPAHSSITVLLDHGFLTNAYPVMNCSGGRNATVQFTYAEALVDSARQKGNRDDITGKHIIGLKDLYTTDGGAKRMYMPLHFRTYRYVQLDITTAAEPLVLNDVYSIFTAYPFKEAGTFTTNDTRLDRIWETGWRTARLCAADSYFDCPYYEQLQYVGDTRIQALISLYVSGDDRLMRKAIDDIAHSVIPEGLTQSRYPCRDMQVIPTFSLWWVCMLHDYYMHREDAAFIQQHLDGVQNVLHWFEQRVASNGMLGGLSWWPFVDWSWNWDNNIQIGGVPPGTMNGGSSILTLQYAYTLQRAAELMKRYGRNNMAAQYATAAQQLTKSTYELCMDNQRQMLADTYLKKEFSQHANILAILTDAIPKDDQAALLQRVIKDTAITQTTYYFTFYTFEALKKTGLGDMFLPMLKPWQTMLDIGLTTFAENPEPVRSDCHAWSASPDYEFLSLVCGVKPLSPGFSTVLIEPYPGALQAVEGKVPHPAGMISVKYKLLGEKLHASIDLPPNVTGIFRWKGKDVSLSPGMQTLDL